MPWKETNMMDERLRFIARLSDGDGMSEVCRDFGISRKTGHKIWSRYQNEGLTGLGDRTRRPDRLANMTDGNIQRLIVGLKEKRQNWGAGKILARLKRDHSDIVFPSRTTVHAILERHGMVKHRGKRIRRKVEGTDRIVNSQKPNELWCADYKGQFKLKNNKYCFPLTITDHFSRFVLTCDGHDSTKGQHAFPSFYQAFSEYGLPERIRTDNGSPFASSQSLFNLTKLSVWWMRLGIHIERSRPGHPQDNGRHERMHLTLKQEIAFHVAENCLLQQEFFERWQEDYNCYRPHESLSMQSPQEVYTPSPRKYPGKLEDPQYPDFQKVVKITNCGNLWIPGIKQKIFISNALINQIVGLREEEEDLWSVYFMDLKLGIFDAYEGVFHRGDM